MTPKMADHPKPHLPIPIFSFAYFTFLGFWLYVCHRNKKSLHRVHRLMTQLLLLKALTIVFPAQVDHVTWNNLAQYLRLVLLLATAILLVETGWSFLKPFRRGPARKAIMAVIAAQVIANVVIGEIWDLTGDWMSWHLMAFLVINVAGGFSVIFSIGWYAVILKQTFKADKRAGKTMDRLILFFQMYMGVIALVYVAKFWAAAAATVVGGHETFGGAAEELVSLVAYMVVFYRLRPEALRKSEYFVVEEEEEKELAIEVV